MMMQADMKIPNKFNFRKKFVEIMDKAKDADCWAGIEQEYVLYDGSKVLPYGWKNHKDPGSGPQGPYYCGVGGSRIYGRDIVEEHMQKCIAAGIHFYGLNAEVMPSQWEFQIGTTDPLTVADDLWMARYILARVTEKFGVQVSYHPKPELGGWNGSGGHVNFSTKFMRGDKGIDYINDALVQLEKSHLEDIEYYGKHNEMRMTGNHETSDYYKFSSGIGNRGASVRISKEVHYKGKGFIEDRRPASNLNPYKVLSRLVRSIVIKK